MTQRKQPVCDACGSPEIMGDAYATWDVELQEWTVDDVFDKGGYCPDCDGEARLKWVPYVEPTDA